jgi:hypothetical protein
MRRSRHGRKREAETIVPSDGDVQWIARLAPPPGASRDDLLRLSLGLDIWERHPDYLIVVGAAGQLQEIERRQVGRVEWIEPVAAYLARHQAGEGP